MCSENFRIFLYNKNDLIIMIGKTMKCIILKTFFLIILFSTANLNAQYPLGGPAPLKPGNFWLYAELTFENSFSHSWQILDSIIINDSSEYYVVEGKSYFNHNQIGMVYQYYRINSDNYYIQDTSIVFSHRNVKYYKKNAQLHDAWVNLFFTGIPAYYEIIDTGTYNWSGNIVKYNY